MTPSVPDERDPTTRPDGGVHASHPLRGGGTLDVTTDALVVDQGGDRIHIGVDSIVEVSYSKFDYFVGLLSVAIVGFGLLSLERNLLLALAFVAVGLASLYRTYRKRGELVFRVTGRAKPLVVYPEHPEAVYDAIEPYVAAT